MLVLIVEDDPIVALLLEASLADAGHQLLGPVEGCADALSLAAQHHPELALVNIELRHGDSGVQLARALRDRWQIPSVFTTGSIDEARCNRDAALGVLCKPYSTEAAAAMVGVAASIIRGEPVDARAAGENFEVFADVAEASR